MAHYLKAILGELKRLQAAAAAMPPSVVVLLADELGLIPLTEELFDAINKLSFRRFQAGQVARCR
jgi:hypothetical protein